MAAEESDEFKNISQKDYECKAKRLALQLERLSG